MNDKMDKNLIKKGDASFEASPNIIVNKTGYIL